jgi:hypothetical protein
LRAVWFDAIAFVVLAGAWTLWQRHRHGDEPVDEELEEREERFGGRYMLAWARILAVLTVGLVLQGAGVRGAAWVALAGVVGMLLLFYVVPWFGPRRSRRSREESGQR